MSLKKASRTKSLSLSGDDFPLRPAAASKPKATFATAKRPEDTLKIMKYIDDNVIGKGVAFLGPYGRRKGKATGNGE
uniref:Putative selenocysteine lyase/cysteine desulfurase posttranslational modification n=1 Tax=Anopheles darlingi TaxID=43151 RepID=A0A2M4CIY4_ANODA